MILQLSYSYVLKYIHQGFYDELVLLLPITMLLYYQSVFEFHLYYEYSYSTFLLFYLDISIWI